MYVILLNTLIYLLEFDDLKKLMLNNKSAFIKTTMHILPEDLTIQNYCRIM